MDQSGPACKQSLPSPMPRGRRLLSASREPDQGRVSIMKIDGGCHCGYITYEAEADPEKPSSAIARTASISPDRRFAPSSASLVSRFRSSQTFAAPSDANFGIKGTLRKSMILVRFLDLKFLSELAAQIKTAESGLPPMWNANLLDCRRRRAEIVLHPCGDCTPTYCACPEGADLVSLATAVDHRPGLCS